MTRILSDGVAKVQGFSVRGFSPDRVLVVAYSEGVPPFSASKKVVGNNHELITLFTSYI